MAAPASSDPLRRSSYCALARAATVAASILTFGASLDDPAAAFSCEASCVSGALRSRAARRSAESSVERNCQDRYFGLTGVGQGGFRFNQPIAVDEGAEIPVPELSVDQAAQPVFLNAKRL